MAKQNEEHVFLSTSDRNSQMKRIYTKILDDIKQHGASAALDTRNVTAIDRIVSPDAHLSSAIRGDYRYLFRLCSHMSGKSDKLSAPIVMFEGKLRKIVQFPPGIVQYVNSLKTTYNLTWESMQMLSGDSEELYGTILQSASRGRAVSHHIEKQLNKSIAAINDILMKLSPDSMHEFDTQSFSMNSALVSKYAFGVLWNDLRENMVQMQTTGSYEWDIYDSGTSGHHLLLYTGEYAILLPYQKQITHAMIRSTKAHLSLIVQAAFANKNAKKYLFDFDQVKGIADTIVSRTLVSIYDENLHKSCISKVGRQNLEEMWLIYDSLFITHGNEAFAQLKMLESLSMGVMLDKGDTLVRPETFLQTMLATAKEKGFTSALTMVAFLQKLTIFQINECVGLYRTWMHPTVDEEKGCEKVQKIVQDYHPPNEEALMHIDGCLKKQFCISFADQNGRWPVIDLSHLSPTSPLYRAIKEGSRILNLKSAIIPLQDWAKIKIQGEETFNYYVDFTEMITDRSMAPLKCDVDGVYDPSITGKYTMNPGTRRRVLEEILARPEISIKAICDAIQRRDIPEIFRIVMANAKERELKKEPRLFAMLVLEMRLYFCVTEHNISEKIFKYYSQQTMTSSEAKLTSKMYSMSKVREDNDVLELIIGIDFTSWNLYWTHASTVKTFTFLDEVFDTPNLYTYTHDFFSSCDIFLNSRFNPPNYVLNEDGTVQHLSCRSWKNHHGGFEGLRQKGWTLITIGLLLYVGELTGVDCTIIGQGDNQVLKIQMPAPGLSEMGREEWIKMHQGPINAKIDEIMTAIKEQAAHIGLIVKPEESSVSSSFLSYGKVNHYNGVQLSQALKRISRCLTDVNELFPTIQDKMATIQTAGHSTANKTIEMAVPYAVCQLETLMLFQRDVKKLSRVYSRIVCDYPTIVNYQNLDDLSVTFLSFLLRTCADVFNIPIMSFTQYAFRGFSDTLSTYLTTLHILAKKKDPIAIRLIKWLEYKQYVTGNGSMELLASNPGSINIATGSAVGSTLKPYMNRYLQENTVNHHLSEVFSIQTDEFSKGFFGHMSTWTPVYPRVMNEVLRQTISGVAMAFLGKFDTTQTIQKLAGKDEIQALKLEVDATDQIYICHILLFYFFTTNVSIETPLILPCPTQLAQAIRDDTWAEAVDGESIRGVTLPHPAHILKTNLEDISIEQGPIAITILPDVDLNYTHMSQRGTRPIYLGTRTRERRTGKIFNIVNASRPLDAALRLCEIREWCFQRDTPLYQFLNQLAVSRTNVPLDVLDNCRSRTLPDKSHIHRLRDVMTSHEVLPNFVPTVTGFCLFSTDECGDLSKGMGNYNVNFSALILWIFRLMLTSIIAHKEIPKMVIANLFSDSDCCLVQEIEVPINTFQNTPPPEPLCYPHNPLVYALVDSNVDLPTLAMGQVTTKMTPVEAAGMILMQRMSVSLSNKMWSDNAEMGPVTSVIGVSEVIRIGVVAMIKAFARLFIIYQEDVSDTMTMKIRSVPKAFWGGLVEFALFPEIQQDIKDYLHVNGVPEPFTNENSLRNAMLLVLSKGIIQEKIKLLQDANWKIVYSVGKGLALARVIRMWSYTNVLKGIYRTKTHNILISSLTTITKEARLGKNIIKLLDEVLKGENITYHDVILRNPLIISQDPAELYLRPKKELKPMFLREFQLSSYRQDMGVFNNSMDQLPICLQAFPDSTIMEAEIIFTQLDPIKAMSNPSSLIRTDRPRFRFDQAYKDINTVSSAWTKALQLYLTLYGPLPKEPSIHLCEGEGSICKTTHEMTGHLPFYNSLLNKETLAAQRYTHFAPGSYFGSGVRPDGCDLCVIHGGDLTDTRYFKAVLSRIPQQASVVTMDAEKSTEFSTEEAFTLLKHTIQIALQSNARLLLIKGFVQSTERTTWVCETLRYYYSTVYVTVPIGSSYEGLEIYYVAKHRTGQEWQGFFTTNFSDHLRTRVDLQVRDKRIAKEPFQKKYPEMWNTIRNIGRSMGYTLNHTRALSTFLMTPIVCMTREGMMDYVKMVKVTALDQANSAINATGKSYTGKKLTIDESMSIAKSASVSRSIDQSLDVYRNAHILENFITAQNQTILMENTIKYLSTAQSVEVTDPKTKHVIVRYSRKGGNVEEWKRQHLKSLMKIYGWYNNIMNLL